MAHPPREKGGKVVFIGNIPYGVSEEQICHTFGTAGTVVNFRLVYDKETGRPKGFGFLEYTNVDDAASAVRNLDGFEIMGRTLRVDYSNDNGGGGAKATETGSGRAPPPAQFGMEMIGQHNGAPQGELPPVPSGQDLPPGVSAPDAISKTLGALPPAQLLDILSQMKGLVSTEPAKAQALLTQAPQLSYAIFQALLLLGLVDTTIVGQLIQQAPPQQAQAAPQMPQPPAQIPQQPPMPVHYGGTAPLPAAPSYPQQYVAPTPQNAYPQGYQQPGYAPTPPAQQPAYHPPAQQQYQTQTSVPLPADPAQAALIQQLLSMSREQIMALDDAARSQVMVLRAHYGAPV